MEPVPEPGTAPHRLTLERRALISPESGSPQVLVVEDDPGALELMQTILEMGDIRVLTAKSAYSGLQAWHQYRPGVDLVIADVVLPHGPSGFEMAQCILKTDPGQPFLFMSGYGIDMLRSPFHLEEGVNFLKKPFHLRDLTEMVSRVLARGAVPAG